MDAQKMTARSKNITLTSRNSEADMTLRNSETDMAFSNCNFLNPIKQKPDRLCFSREMFLLVPSHVPYHYNTLMPLN
jgi:hypothetical protein